VYLAETVKLFFCNLFFQILTGNDMGWKLVTLDENKHGGNAPKICHVILRSASFRLLVMGVILANGVVTATMHFEHDGRPRHVFYERYYYIEVSKTLCDLFNVPASCTIRRMYSQPWC
jgi:hypothetical protein